MKLIIRRIESERKRRRWSKAKMARFLRVSYMTYLRWTSGQVQPSQMAVRLLEDGLRRLRKQERRQKRRA